MGQANSMYTITERGDYFCGDTVRGSINLSCIQPFQCNSVHMTILGEERTHWTEQHSRTRTLQDGRTETETYTENFDGHNVFFKVKVLVFNFGGFVQPGQYTFPFVFQLPMGLPGVFDGMSSMKAHGSISYSIHGECEVGGMFNPNIRHLQPFTVKEPLQQNVTPLRYDQVSNVNCCCCFGRGTANLSVHVDKNCYAPGEVARIICNVRNESSEAFSRIEVKLVRTMNLRTGTGFHHHTCTDVVSVNSYPGVSAGTINVDANALQLPLQLAANICASVRGRIVQCEYAVVVTLVAGGCCIGNVSVNVPVRIYAPQPPPPMAFQAPPPNWAPTAMPLVSVNIPPPSADALPPPYDVVGMQPPYQPAPTSSQPPWPAPTSSQPPWPAPTSSQPPWPAATSGQPTPVYVQATPIYVQPAPGDSAAFEKSSSY